MVAPDGEDLGGDVLSDADAEAGGVADDLEVVGSAVELDHGGGSRFRRRHWSHHKIHQPQSIYKSQIFEGE